MKLFNVGRLPFLNLCTVKRFEQIHSIKNRAKPGLLQQQVLIKR